jgi:hypothetical protein
MRCDLPAMLYWLCKVDADPAVGVVQDPGRRVTKPRKCVGGRIWPGDPSDEGPGFSIGLAPGGVTRRQVASPTVSSPSVPPRPELARAASLAGRVAGHHGRRPAGEARDSCASSAVCGTRSIGSPSPPTVGISWPFPGCLLVPAAPASSNAYCPVWTDATRRVRQVAPSYAGWAAGRAGRPVWCGAGSPVWRRPRGWGRSDTR